jgi:hypothetical protein
LSGKSQPFYNPHLLFGTAGHEGVMPERADAASERLALEKSFYARLLDHTTCYLFNSGVAGADKIKEIIG